MSGLSFQSHPTIVVMLPAGLAYVLMRQRRLLWSRWAALGLIAALFVNINLLYFNLVSNGSCTINALAVRNADGTTGSIVFQNPLPGKRGNLGQNVIEMRVDRCNIGPCLNDEQPSE